MGPLVSSEQFDRITGYIKSGRESGRRSRSAVSGSAISAISSHDRVREHPARHEDRLIGPVVCASRSMTTISPHRQGSQRHLLRPRRQRLDPQRRHRAQARAAYSFADGVDQLPQPVRRSAAVRRLQVIGLGREMGERCSTTTPRSRRSRLHSRATAERQCVIIASPATGFP